MKTTRVISAYGTAAMLVLLCVIKLTNGHGRLLEPPGRSSMWRVGFNTPINYNDNALYCGGFQNQYQYQGGKCGICGDPYQGPRENEAGGKYATGKISRKYSQGQTIDVTVEVTANHLGWFEFKICPNNNPRKAATQECLDRHVLQKADGTGSKLYIGRTMDRINIKLRLPADVTCTQCVLQWRYHAGNSYGVDASGKSCLGCGDQEEFYGCSDVEITAQTHVDLPQTGNLVVPQSNPVVPQSNPVVPQGNPVVPQGNPVVPQAESFIPQTGSFIPQGGSFIPQGTPQGGGSNNGQQPSSSSNFIPVGIAATPSPVHAGIGQFQPVGVLQCRAISPMWRGQPELDAWCQYNCLTANNCPHTLCACM